MQDSHTLELRDRLRKALFSLTCEFGPTFPVNRERVGESTIVAASDFSVCYPDLDILCHYTDASGLEGILKSGTFWATNAAYLNDPEEFRFAHHVFVRMVRTGSYALDQTFAGAFLNGLRTWGHEKELARTFFISFSARRDDLSQFRAYSDKARGYALEFKPCDLIQALNSYLRRDSGEYFTLRRVRYGADDLARFHTRAIDELKSCVSQLPYPEGSAEFLTAVQAFGMDFQDYLREAGVVFKQEGYKSEEEYRAVLDVHGLLVLPCHLEERLAVRFRGGLPVPYLPFQFLPDPRKEGYLVRRDNKAGLVGIVAGPSLDFDQTKTGLFYLLRQNGFTEVDIQVSKCSYRSW